MKEWRFFQSGFYEVIEANILYFYISCPKNVFQLILYIKVWYDMNVKKFTKDGGAYV